MTCLRFTLLAVLLPVVLLKSVASAQSARPVGTNPAHLSEMPAVESVLREFTAANPRDTVARQMGALQQLQEIVEELSNGRTALGTETPDEKRILQEYRNARHATQWQLVKTPQDEALLPELRRFDEDPAFREEVLTKFFSPALQAQSRNLSRVLMQRRAVLRQQNAAFGGTAQAPAAASRPTAPAAQARANVAPAAPVTPEPSIAKAKAANVDTRVFGLQLGEPLNLPPCRALIPTEMCVLTGLSELGAAIELTGFRELGAAIEQLTGDLDGTTGGDTGLTKSNISLPRASCPNWFANCEITALTDPAGRLVSVQATTAGTSMDALAVDELSAKYGARYSRQEHFATPTAGGNTIKVWRLEWQLPGLRVLYDPVFGTITQGVLLIETETLHQRRIQQNKQRKL